MDVRNNIGRIATNFRILFECINQNARKKKIIWPFRKKMNKNWRMVCLPWPSLRHRYRRRWRKSRETNFHCEKICARNIFSSLSPCASTPKLNLKSFAWKHSVGSFNARRGSHSFTQWSGKFFFFYTFKQIPIRIYCLPINWTQHHRYDAHASGCRLMQTDNATIQREWKLRKSERSKQTIEPHNSLPIKHRRRIDIA